MSILRKTLLAGIGAFEISREKAEKFIDDLIAKGELNKSERAEAIMEVLDRAEKRTSEFATKVARDAEQAATNFAQDVKWATQKDLERLEGKVNELFRLLSDLDEKMAGRKGKSEK